MFRTRFKRDVVTEFLAPTRPGKRQRAIVLCDGMPSIPRKQPLAEFLSGKGYWVFYPRYRGAWESGGEFLARSPHLDIPAIPAWVKEETWQKTGTDFLIASQEWGPGGSYHQMSAFEKRAGQEFLLTASGHPTVKAHLNRLTLSSGAGSFQAYAAQFATEDKAKLVPRVAYNIQPINISETYL